MPCSVFNHGNNLFCTDGKADQRGYVKQVRNGIACFLSLENVTKIAESPKQIYNQRYTHNDFIYIHTNEHSLISFSVFMDFLRSADSLMLNGIGLIAKAQF